MQKLPVYIQSLAGIHPQTAAENNQLVAREPDYRQWITDSALRRRMSRIVKMGVTAGLQCLQQSAAQPDAIITATGLGCLADSEKFLQSISAQAEELLSPTPFIQSTFNTIGAQIALLSGNKAYNNTYVHRAFSFESALLDAMMQLQGGEAQNVLVGAVDELTPTLFRLLNRMRVWQKYPAGEGASFFLLSGAKNQRSIARLIGIDMQSGAFLPRELEEMRQRFLEDNGAKNARVVSAETYKPVCGEYHTASAFGLWHACTQFNSSGYYVVCNSFLDNHTAILIKKETES